MSKWAVSPGLPISKRVGLLLGQNRSWRIKDIWPTGTGPSKGRYGSFPDVESKPNKGIISDDGVEWRATIDGPGAVAE